MTTATDTSAVDRVVRSVRRVPGDAILLVAGLLVVDLVVASAVGGAVRVLVGLPLLFFLPGYALLTVLFPRQARTPAASLSTRVADRRGALSLGERAALSFGTSLVLLAPLGVLLSASGIGLGRGPVVAALSLVVLVGAVGGAVRRVQLPSDERYALPYASWLDAVAGTSPGGFAANLTVAVAVLLALSALTIGLFPPGSAEAGTQLSLLEADGTGGYTTADPPAAVARGASVPLVVGITNDEGREHTYTVVAELQRVRDGEAGQTVVQRRELRRLEIPVGAGETVREPHTVSPTLAGEDLRLTYHLYVGQAPEDPSRETAYRTVHVWFAVRP